MDNFKRIAFAFLATALFTSFNDVSAQEVEVEEVVVTATRREAVSYTHLTLPTILLV